MAICDITELPSLVTSGKTLLGIDNGSVAIGLAVSDPTLCVASPITVIVRASFSELAQQIAEIVQRRNVGGIVIGLPLTPEGKESAATQSARALARNLLRTGNLPVADMPIAFWDERFSTAAIKRMLIADDMTRQRRSEVIDKAAAAYILQGALDRLATLRRNAVVN